MTVLETYGMTEAASQIAANPLDGPRRPGSVGLPVEAELRVVRPDDEACAAHEIGSVEIRGAGVVPGPLPGGWLVTGDLGYLDADGFLFLTGRVGDVINRGGEKVFPRPVEEELLRDTDVVEVAVVARPDPVLGSVPVAFVVPRGPEHAAALATRLRARCDEHLTKARRPAAVHIVHALPTGATGKISRRLVRDGQQGLVAHGLASA
jgi:acyl-CoA synthetase (AMP-forming)/AMP-acid ligase II